MLHISQPGVLTRREIERASEVLLTSTIQLLMDITYISLITAAQCVMM